jgi:uncharacterized protein (UPF0147 family)
MDKELEDRVQNIVALMEPVLDDRSVPRNIRRAVSDGKDKIQEKSDDLSVQVSTAIYLLDEVANDINMPMHARSEIWNIISELERLKEDIKE